MDLESVLIGEDDVVPRARYTSPEFAALEFERLWARVWQVACREEEIAEVGEFCEYLIGDQSILVVRSDPDTVGAFHNTCLHRGTRLADGTGHFDDGCIRCRYHAWRYDLDGRLDRGRRPPTSSTRSAAGPGLKPVQVDRWGGFVWVCLDPARATAARLPRPAADPVGPVPPATGSASAPTCRPSSRPTGRWWSTPSTRATTSRAPTRRSCRGPTTSASTTSLSASTPTTAACPTRGANYVRAHASGLAEGEYDEGEILENFVGPGRALLRRRARPDRGDPLHHPDGETMLSRYQKGRRALLVARGVAVEEFTDDQLTSADDVYFFPNMVGPDLPGHRHRLPGSAQRHRSGQLHQGHLVPRVAQPRRASEAGRAPLLPGLDRARLGRDHEPGLRQHGTRADRHEVPRTARHYGSTAARRATSSTCTG